MTWISDPDTRGICSWPEGESCVFGNYAVQLFTRVTGCSHIIRAHQASLPANFFFCFCSKLPPFPVCGCTAPLHLHIPVALPFSSPSLCMLNSLSASGFGYFVRQECSRRDGVLVVALLRTVQLGRHRAHQGQEAPRHRTCSVLPVAARCDPCVCVWCVRTVMAVHCDLCIVLCALRPLRLWLRTCTCAVATFLSLVSAFPCLHLHQIALIHSLAGHDLQREADRQPARSADARCACHDRSAPFSHF